MHGLNGYIVLIDFSKFFPNCAHDVIRDIHIKYINDSFAKKVIEDYCYYAISFLMFLVKLHK